MIEFDYQINYFDLVDEDIENAKFWYYEQNPDTDLEERFAQAIKVTIEKIIKEIILIRKENNCK